LTGLGQSLIMSVFGNSRALPVTKYIGIPSAADRLLATSLGDQGNRTTWFPPLKKGGEGGFLRRLNINHR